MKKKVGLEDLEIESFLADIDSSEAKNAKGAGMGGFEGAGPKAQSDECSDWLCDSTDVSQNTDCYNNCTRDPHPFPDA